MCYMSSTSASPASRTGSGARVGVRELRQNLSVYLERVIAGESLEVTDRGRAVALLVPLLPGATLVDRLVASGRAIPARRQVGDLPPLKGRVPAGLGARAQRALQEMGADSI
jgi:prevent-host-death family protein